MSAPAAPRRMRRVAARLHAAASADGAGPSGLASLLWTHALQSGGDALVAVSLASTAFFQVSAAEARGKIALYLLLTLLPFSFLIPVAGPLLDRFPHGRRNVLALTCGGRGLVTWTLAGSLASLSLYPQALLILILARAYGVARSAAVVRVRPPDLGLVAANARLNVASVSSSAVAASIGVLIANTVGTEWVLRLATFVFLAAAIAAIRLPSHVDSERAHRGQFTAWRLAEASRIVRRALTVTTSLRAVSGLLTLGLAILLKAHGAPAYEVAFVLGAAVVGSLVGTGLASHLPADRAARLTAWVLLLPSVMCLVAALGATSLLRALAVGTVGMGASLGKYSLDASLQGEMLPTRIGSAFARSETSLQLGWALGGALGLAASLADRTALGADGAVSFVFGVGTVISLAGLIVAARWSRRAPTRVSAQSPRE